MTVADGWTGVEMQKNHSQFKNVMDGPGDQRTNQPTRQGVVACPQLKMAYRKKNKKR